MTTPSPIAAPELKPCPFCGGTDVKLHEQYIENAPGYGYLVYRISHETHLRMDCRASVSGADKEKAIAGWNRRTSIELPAAVKLLREAAQLAISNYGNMLTSDPPQDAWKFNRVSARLAEALRLTASIEQPAGEPIGYISDGVIEHALAKGFGASTYIQAGQPTKEFPIAIYAAPPASDPTDAQKLATLRDGLAKFGWCAEFGALAQEVLFPPAVSPAVWTQEMLDQIAVDAERLRAKIRPGIDAVTGLPAVFGVPVEPCLYPGKMGTFACDNRHQCWESCGELGKSAEHAKRAPSTRAQQVADAQAEVATWPDSIRAQNGMAGAPVDERAVWPTFEDWLASDIPPQVSTTEYARLAFSAARAALQQPGRADKGGL